VSTFLITGGAGFIGSHLVEAVLAGGDTVVVLDDFSTGRRENIHHLLPRIRLIEGSITDLATCRRAVSGVDYVLHEGALPSVPRSVNDPIRSHTVNATGTLNLLVAARDEGVKRFVYAGSSSVYGDTPVLPKVETMPPNPRSPYATAKFAAETYCRTFYELFGLETIVLRYFNVFGPRQDPESDYAAVIPKFINYFLSDTAPTIFGDGTQSRDFTYVENVVRANLLACETPHAAPGQFFNCACGRRVTLNELAEHIRTLTGATIRPHYAPKRPGEVTHSLADLSRAQQYLGYRPLVDVFTGLERTVEWYRAAQTDAAASI
jgi:nucleoside-diphosphate-sugar epimerase